MKGIIKRNKGMSALIVLGVSISLVFDWGNWSDLFGSLMFWVAMTGWLFSQDMCNKLIKERYITAIRLIELGGKPYYFGDKEDK